MARKLRFPGYRYREVEQPYYISGYQLPENIEVEEVYRADEDVIVECSAVYTCTVEGFVPKLDAHILQEQDVVSVTDWNWNDHYAEVEFTGNVYTKFLIRLAETKEEAADEFEYNLQSVEVTEAALEDDEYW